MSFVTGILISLNLEVSWNRATPYFFMVFSRIVAPILGNPWMLFPDPQVIGEIADESPGGCVQDVQPPRPPTISIYLTIKRRQLFQPTQLSQISYISHKISYITISCCFNDSDFSQFSAGLLDDKWILLHGKTGLWLQLMHPAVPALGNKSPPFVPAVAAPMSTASPWGDAGVKSRKKSWRYEQLYVDGCNQLGPHILRSCCMLMIFWINWTSTCPEVLRNTHFTKFDLSLIGGSVLFGFLQVPKIRCLNLGPHLISGEHTSPPSITVFSQRIQGVQGSSLKSKILPNKHIPPPVIKHGICWTKWSKWKFKAWNINY